MARLWVQALASLLALPLAVADEWSEALKPGLGTDAAKAPGPAAVWANVKVPKAKETECLRQLTHGCSEIKNRGVCLHSRDGRKKADTNYSDIDVYDSPCVWCGDSQCTGVSDSLCEPLEYLMKGAPKYYPSFLTPGSFQVASCEKKVPLPDLDYGCLLWATEGCHVIKEKNLCLRSLDGRTNNEYLGKQVFKDPCVWCGGGVCTEVNDDKCLPFDYLMNGKGTIYNFWHTPEFSTFAACDGAHFRAARIGPGPDYNATFVEEVRQCDGPHWTVPKECPEGFSCVKRVGGVNSFCESVAPAPGYFITAGKQVWWHDRTRDQKHMVPPGINCARCGCQGTMTMVTQDVIDAIPTGQVFDNCDDLISTQSLQPAANQTAGLFISFGKQVWWHSPKDDQKHLVEPGIDCSKCGCKGKISLVSESTLTALPTGDPFDCGMFDEAKSPQAATQTVGRFVSAGKQVWWQSPADGLKHLVPPGIDCANCGCKDATTFVDQSTLDALRTGADFDCSMYRKAQASITDDLGAAGAAPEDEKPRGLGPMAVIIPLLAVLGSGVLCWAGYTSQLCGSPKECKSRCAELSSEESADEQGDDPRVLSRMPLVPAGAERAAAVELPSEASPVGSDLATPASSTIRAAPQAVSLQAAVLRPATTVLCPVVPTTVSYTSFATSTSPRSPQTTEPVQTFAARGVDIERPPDIFDQIDRDHDGQITREEWQRYAFDAFDQNHDGQVSAEEFRRARMQP